MSDTSGEAIRVFLRTRIGLVAGGKLGDTPHCRGYVEGCRYAIYVVDTLEGVAGRNAPSEAKGDPGEIVPISRG